MKCIIKECKTRYGPGAPVLYTVPTKNLERRRAWLAGVKREDLLNKSGKHFVCSKHFVQTDVYGVIRHKHSLKPSIVPSLDVLNKEGNCYPERTLDPAKTKPKIPKGIVNRTEYGELKYKLKIQKCKTKWRRFELQDKLFALTLLKHGRTSYHLLRKRFLLPSPHTLTSLMSQIPFHAGINEIVINNLKSAVHDMSTDNRNCILMWNELLLSPGLQYDSSRDCILGFVDNGKDRVQRYADRCMVFLIQGIRKKWKQPVAFFFVETGMQAATIVSVLKDVIRKLRAIGLNVVATVCDQRPSNCSAWRILKQDTDRLYLRQGLENNATGFILDRKEIVFLFDPPHLLNCMRDNFLENDVQFKEGGETKCASWKHIIAVSEIVVGDQLTRVCYKLTEIHIDPKLDKMKVKYAAQALSQQVAGMMRFAATAFSLSMVRFLPIASIETSAFIFFMDQLFDSCNGNEVFEDTQKPLRSAVRKGSAHLAFWRGALKILKTVRFIKPDGSQVQSITVLNWIHTLRGFMFLRRKFIKYSRDSLLLRPFNKDGLENILGIIRAHGVRNIHPTCYNFKLTLKTLIVNNFSLTSSPNCNCEDDKSAGALDTMTKFFTCSPSSKERVATEFDEQFIEFCTALRPSASSLARRKNMYLAGIFANTMIKKIGRCKTCYTSMVTNLTLDQHEFINASAYNKNSLLKANTPFLITFQKGVLIIDHFMQKYAHTLHLKAKLKKLLYIALQAGSAFKCQIHNLEEVFIESLATVYIYFFTKQINNCLTGKIKKCMGPKKFVGMALEKYRRCFKKK